MTPEYDTCICVTFIMYVYMYEYYRKSEQLYKTIAVQIKEAVIEFVPLYNYQHHFLKKCHLSSFKYYCQTFKEQSCQK